MLLIKDLRLSAVYAPRPVFMDPADLPHGKEAFLLGASANIEGHENAIPGYRLGRILYENPKAVVETYRTPGRQPTIGSVRVAQLIRN